MSTFTRPIPIVEPSRVALVFVIASSVFMADAGQSALSAGPDGPPLVRSHSPIVDVEPGASPAGSLSWKVPPTWKSTPPTNAMRKAQYALPPAAGDRSEAECVVFYFGAGQGGDAKSNVERWASMFTAADGGPAPHKAGEVKVGGRVITRMEAWGTYAPTAMGMGGPPPEPKPGWMMLGAVVPGDDANWFFRCAGPKKTIEAERANFDTLLASIK